MNPPNGFVPFTISVVILVERAAANRQLCLEWFIDREMPNASCLQLEGEQSKRAYQFYRVLREAGEWTVQARVIRNDGVRIATATVTALGR